MTPLILAVDTTGEHGSLALARGAELLEELPIEAPTGYAQVLYASLESLLARHAVKISEVDCFAAANGPGTFTGVRVGLACVKGLAEALGKPAVAVSNLAALAACGQAPLRAPLIDARRGEYYAAVYDAAGALIIPEQVVKLPDFERLVPPGVEFLSDTRPLAAAVARLARTQPWQDPAALDANYVRRSDAELSWKESL